ncbi:LysR family transcriptional regulator [Paraburkholderia silviterrae]|uniref:LysR family transcriptional regulator n=1 Tax=Paraburkholderia silviterrae TaxID=2528715 RepID=A0A4R5M9F2_9BURK|nr:LysR family transcriptional regulator [Paraburkholderia silviterrae]TDG22793.1 LysR family transcriptional regulator [Paraburkholderia silviterrae]
MRKNLDIGLLHAMHAFIRVVDSGSFTAAASQMDLTTAQISRLVSELEERLEAKLLQRTTRRLSLTSTGERYLADARTILDLVLEVESNAKGGAVEPSGRLRVLCMSGFGNRYVVPLVSGYSARFPKVTVEYCTSQYMPDLVAGAVDVSVYLAQRLPDSNLVSQRLGATSAVLCATPGYLAQHGTPRTPAELADRPCLRLVNPSLSSNWELEDGKRLVTIQPRGPVVGDNPEVVLQSVLDGLGVALLPRHDVVDSLRTGALVQVLPKWQSPEIGVYLLTPSRKFLDAKTREWISLLKAEIPPALERDAAFFAGPPHASNAN